MTERIKIYDVLSKETKTKYEVDTWETSFEAPPVKTDVRVAQCPRPVILTYVDAGTFKKIFEASRLKQPITYERQKDLFYEAMMSVRTQDGVDERPVYVKVWDWVNEE